MQTNEEKPIAVIIYRKHLSTDCFLYIYGIVRLVVPVAIAHLFHGLVPLGPYGAIGIFGRRRWFGHRIKCRHGHQHGPVVIVTDIVTSAGLLRGRSFGPTEIGSTVRARRYKGWTLGFTSIVGQP